MSALQLPVFDSSYWEEVVTHPNWYETYVNFIKTADEKLKADDQKRQDFHKQLRHFFERALQGGKIPMASEGINLDKERLPIDKLVIHHTSAEPGYRLSYLNAVHLLNIYAPYFASPTVEGEEALKGSPIWSNHFYNGQQVFWGYHWLMRMDGTFIRLLEDDQLGWHAGNWQVNRSSVAICIDNDYDVQDPSEEVLRKLADHIATHYPGVAPGGIIGHCEARQGISCPGKNFMRDWKASLLKYVEAQL